MSTITTTVVTEQNPITISLTNVGQIGVVVDTLDLNVFTTGGLGNPEGATGAIQYNNGSGFGGISTMTSDGTTTTISDQSAIKIGGGSNGYILQTDGTGNVTWSQVITSPGSGIPGGANTQVQFNSAGDFGGVAGFTFDEVTGDLNVPGTITANGSGLSSLTGANVTGFVPQATVSNVAIKVSDAAQPNITSVGTLISLDVTGNIIADNITANGVLSGNGSNLSDITGANVSGVVANATHALTANTVVDAAQPNITSVGTLIDLSVTNDISADVVSANTLSGTLTTNAQPNITEIGTLVDLDVSGNTILSGLSRVTERVQIDNTVQPSSINIDAMNGTSYYFGEPLVDDFILNIRWGGGDILSDRIALGQSISFTFIVENPASQSYSLRGIDVDGFLGYTSPGSGLVSEEFINTSSNFLFDPRSGHVGVYRLNLIHVRTGLFKWRGFLDVAWYDVT